MDFASCQCPLHNHVLFSVALMYTMYARFCDAYPQHALRCVLFVLKIALSSRQSLCLEHIIFAECSGHLLIMGPMRTTFTSDNDGFCPQATSDLPTAAHCQSGSLARSNLPTNLNPPLDVPPWQDSRELALRRRTPTSTSRSRRSRKLAPSSCEKTKAKQKELDRLAEFGVYTVDILVALGKTRVATRWELDHRKDGIKERLGARCMMPSRRAKLRAPDASLTAGASTGRITLPRGQNTNMRRGLTG